MLNNTIIRRKRIQVSMAKYAKTGRQEGSRTYGKSTKLNESQGKRVWRRKEQNSADIVRINQGNTIKAFKIMGDKSLEAVKWLERSIVGESTHPIEVNTLTNALVSKAGMQIQIRELSCFKFIVTFPSVMLMEESLRNHVELEEWFTCITKWNLSVQNETRKVWLEVFGAPPHGWLEVNFRKIAEIWGSLISLDQEITTSHSYESMKILVAT